MELSKDKIVNLPVFFIIGRPRSGTTLLRTLLDSHPNVIIPLECSFIIQLKNKYSRQLYWEEKDLKDFHTDLEKTRFFTCLPHFFGTPSETLDITTKLFILGCPEMSSVDYQ